MVSQPGKGQSHQAQLTKRFWSTQQTSMSLATSVISMVHNGACLTYFIERRSTVTQRQQAVKL